MITGQEFLRPHSAILKILLLVPVIPPLVTI